jgi:predicted MFS family arabinose efflux permease
MALGGWLGGALFDASGAYTSAILVAATIGYVGVPLSLWLPRHQKAAPPRAKAMATA